MLWYLNVFSKGAYKCFGFYMFFLEEANKCFGIQWLMNPWTSVSKHPHRKESEPTPPGEWLGGICHLL